MLEDFGCDVVGPLASVDKVLESAQRGGLDGALLDVNLRGQRIFEILPTLQKLGLRLIITSGYNDELFFRRRSARRRASPSRLTRASCGASAKGSSQSRLPRNERGGDVCAPARRATHRRVLALIFGPDFIHWRWCAES